MYVYLTYPDYSVEFCHGNLFSSFNGRSNLLLVFLRQERQDLCNNGVQSLGDFSLKNKISLKRYCIKNIMKGVLRDYYESM